MPAYPTGELRFVELLRSHQPFAANWESGKVCPADALDARRGLTVCFDFDDPEKLLDTAIFDLNRFLKEAGVAGSETAVRIIADPALAEEEYSIVIDSDIQISAADTEGIRRAVYALTDMIAASPFLKKGETRRRPWLKNRISRCFFGPIKRPPFNIDELMNDIDYYPDEYLSRLAHDGTNGLWLTVAFREICDTSFRPARPEAAQRIAKLRRTVERCRRYGIKIWAFAIEPIYWAKETGNPVPPGCEELIGPEVWVDGVSQRMFCPKSETAAKYLYECSYSLFSQVPHLGGLMLISLGERYTSCLSKVSANKGKIPCPECEFGVEDILSAVLTPLKKGMLAANPDAGLISWLYMPEESQLADWIYRLPLKLDNDIALAFNFESGITVTQQNKARTGGDYWLSQVGPSDRYGRMAEAARGHCEFAAKMQVACSHEAASIPYIPIPGTIYRKFKAMKSLGVNHVIQCWYFGNYPGLMNEVAGKLAFEDFSTTENEFLNRIAAASWGKDYENVVKAWEHFAEGYSNYPVDNRFQYYGPMHDGPVWPLHLKLAMKPLTRSWKPEKFPSGDAIGECQKQFELHELVEQTRMMMENWSLGMVEMRKISAPGHELDFTLAEALEIQISSAYNILKFYQLREMLLNCDPCGREILDEMISIVKAEIVRSRRLAELCEADARLGYHSEAEVYKYFPEKLEWRAGELEKLLANEFVKAAELSGDPAALADYLLSDMQEFYRPGKVYETEHIKWSFEADFENLKFHLEFPGNYDCVEMAYLYFMDYHGFKAAIPCVIIPKKEGVLTGNGWQADVVVPRSKLRYASCFQVGVERAVFPDGEPEMHFNHKEGNFCHDVRLNFIYCFADKLSPAKL